MRDQVTRTLNDERRIPHIYFFIELAILLSIPDNGFQPLPNDGYVFLIKRFNLWLEARTPVQEHAHQYGICFRGLRPTTHDTQQPLEGGETGLIMEILINNGEYATLHITHHSFNNRKSRWKV